MGYAVQYPHVLLHLERETWYPDPEWGSQKPYPFHSAHVNVASSTSTQGAAVVPAADVTASVMVVTRGASVVSSRKQSQTFLRFKTVFIFYRDIH